MGFVKEFKEFAMRGNVFDMAVGIIIGAAFGKIVGSFVADVLMPPLGLLLGNVNFADLYVNLSGDAQPSLELAKKAGNATLNYGLFINTCIDFLLVAFAVFMLVKQMNRLKKPGAPPAPSTKNCPLCLSVIPLKATKCAHCTSPVPA